MSKAADEVVGEPVTYADLPEEHKKKYDEMKAILEADLIGSFMKTRSHGIRWKGFSPEGALDEVDLSTSSEERTRALRQEINYMVAHSLHRHSESLVNAFERVAATEAGIADLAQVRQKRGETVSNISNVSGSSGTDAIRFVCLRRKRSSWQIGPRTPIKDLTSQAEYSSLSHMVQKLTLYEQRHPELYQDKFKRPVGLVEMEEAEDPAPDLEVAVAELARGANPVPCKWIQMAIEQGRLLFGQFAMKVDTHPFPGVNMVEPNHSARRRLDFSFDVNMAGPERHHGKDKEESSHSRSKEKEEADPRDRPRYDDKRYLTKEQVRSVRYQKPLSTHLLNKYEYQYDQRRQYDRNDERYNRSDEDKGRYRRHDRDDEGQFRAPGTEEAPIAQFDCGPQPVIFEKPREKGYKHMKALYLKGYINGQPVGRMLVDTGAAVNIMPYSMLRRLQADLIKTNVTLNDFNGQASGTQGVLNVDLTIGRKTIPTTFFIVDSKSTYAALLGRDWIHANAAFHLQCTNA
ncbi:hypothetical protein QYE76_047557 [Lolium multiflorum]|uniref:Peptidase A2 domain-containing protein n=1 Tax=Lolium multiflorum TaxID=4521 RepID=A0AAD8TP07_LOLMU|nr:hypothetical protein QYE76_047557 [Lolium multiflorum]